MFTNLQKATISFVMSVCPNEQLGFSRMDLMKFNIWEFFENLSRKFKFHYNRTRITGPLHGDQCKFMKISDWILGRMRKSKYTFYVQKFFPENNHLWDNVEKCGRVGHATSNNIIWCVCFACQITKATDTHSEYIILIAFPRQQWVCECASILCHLYFAHLICHFIFTEWRFQTFRSYVPKLYNKHVYTFRCCFSYCKRGDVHFFTS